MPGSEVRGGLSSAGVGAAASPGCEGGRPERIGHCLASSRICASVSAAHQWVKSCRGLLRSAYSRQRFDQPVEASSWLKSFKTANERFLSQVRSHQKPGAAAGTRGRDPGALSMGDPGERAPCLGPPGPPVPAAFGAEARAGVAPVGPDTPSPRQ